MEDNRIEIRRGDNLFLKQVILHQGIPFSLTLNPSSARITVQSREELDAAIREGIEDYETGRVHSSEEVKQRMKEKYGL